MGAIDAPGLDVIGETPGTGLMPGRPEESPGRWGLVVFGGRFGLFGTCAGLLPGLLGLLGWLWAERNESAARQVAIVPKSFICFIWFLFLFEVISPAAISFFCSP